MVAGMDGDTDKDSSTPFTAFASINIVLCQNIVLDTILIKYCSNSNYSTVLRYRTISI